MYDQATQCRASEDKSEYLNLFIETVFNTSDVTIIVTCSSPSFTGITSHCGFCLLSDFLSFGPFLTQLSPLSYSHYLDIFFDVFNPSFPWSSSVSPTCWFPLQYSLRYSFSFHPHHVTQPSHSFAFYKSHYICAFLLGPLARNSFWFSRILLSLVVTLITANVRASIAVTSRTWSRHSVDMKPLRIPLVSGSHFSVFILTPTGYLIHPTAPQPGML